MSLSRYFVDAYEEDLFNTRYKDIGSEETTWEDLFARVAKTVATNPADELKYDDAMCQGWIIPSSPQLWNYGALQRRYPKNGSSCFTGRLGDTLDSFRQADADAETIYVASGGIGLLANTGRPRGCKIRHCSEGAMGTMCAGGPIRRVEGTTGYITGAGRARGAFMIQLSVWHPDALEFILAKHPSALGWLDDWPTNARAVADGEWVDDFVSGFTERYVHEKNWPQYEDVLEIFDGDLDAAVNADIVKIDAMNRVIPLVTDWSNDGKLRPANRDWDLPLQNCNMSIRVTDGFMRAVEEDRPWAFSWFDMAKPKDGENPWTKTDCFGEGLKEYEDGRIVGMTEDLTEVRQSTHPYRYAVVITTWEGLLQNLSPNKNQWRDTDYARFFRKVLGPTIEKYSGRITAKQVWEIICESAHSHADPGVIFEDTYERYQPVDSAVYGPRLSNPCSEYVNSEGGSCNLVSVNLRACAEAGIQEPWQCLVDTASELFGDGDFTRQLEHVSASARIAIDYINDALNYNEAPVPFIHEMTRDHFRTVGVGIMGLAEFLQLNHVTYGSLCAEQVAACVMSEIALTCWERSFEMVTEGAPVPKGWDAKRMEMIFLRRTDSAVNVYRLPYSQIDRWHALAERCRNGEAAGHTAVTSVAPTGTIAQIARWLATRSKNMLDSGLVSEVTSGVEPSHSWGTQRQDNSGRTTIYHDLWRTEEHGGQPWMVTSAQVTAEQHVRMQAAVCAFTCMSVSKTVNLPASATVQDVMNGYSLAWKLGVPGTALYVDGSKPMQVLSALDCPSGECKVPKK
jgi:ribonucleotide reductase alpha subunit